MKYSIVVPIFNEEENLEKLLKELTSSFGTVKNYEILTVDDGSTDGSLAKLRLLKKKYKNLRVISYKKNIGKSMALLVGFKKAKGDIVVTIDADLQDNPAEILKLTAKVEKGYGVVSGWRKFRHDNLTKKISSIVFNNFVSLTTGLVLHDFNCGLKAYKKEALENINLSGGMHRFIPLLVYWQGYKATEVEVSHRERYKGQSKYGKSGLSRVLKSLFDLATIILLNKYGKRPMRFFGLMGMLFSFLGLLSGAYLVVLHFEGQKIGDRPLLILAVLLMVLGVQFFSLGFIGELFMLKQNEDLPQTAEV